jgi:hypothetical protein
VKILLQDFTESHSGRITAPGFSGSIVQRYDLRPSSSGAMMYSDSPVFLEFTGTVRERKFSFSKRPKTPRERKSCATV